VSSRAVTGARAVALIDGEHYAPVVRDALAELPYDFVGAVLVGGDEKLRGGEEYGVPLVESLDGAELVVDLSDEPVLGPAERMRWASRALARGLPYIGADFHFEPPVFEPFPLPSIAVIGTGKRVGKTAVTCHVIRLLAQRSNGRSKVVAVAMGRGGPARASVCASPPGPEELVELARSGEHAASDYLEIAALTGVPTIGCRRCAGGLAGAVATSNVADGAARALELDPELVVFDGSGAAIPPVATSARILVTRGDATGYLNAYRILVSDLVVALGDPGPVREVKDVPVFPAELRLRPTGPLEGRVAVFTTGAPSDHLEGDLVHVSQSLANRAALAAELQRVEADTYVVEIKAAAIDVVAAHARRQGARVVFADNEVLADGLDEAVLSLA
jgi:cyclic 2,3-diphosphoglycerate synthetase